MLFRECPDDSTFGPTVHGCRDDFDFTLEFERLFLSLVPSTIFIVLALLRLLMLVRQPLVVKAFAFKGFKFSATITYAALQLSLLVLSSRPQKPQALFISSTVVSFVSSLCITAVSLAEHSRSVRPSILLQLYLLLTLLFDITQTRTLWLASSNAAAFTFSKIFTVSVALKTVIILSESHPKSKWIRWDNEKHSPEETIGIFGLSAYTWLNSTFFGGYTKILSIKDLYPLDQRMTTEALQMKLMHHLGASKSKRKSFVLLKALAKTLAPSLLLPIPARLALTGFKFCQPFLINTLLDYLQEPKEGSSRNYGYGLIGAAVLIYSGIAISTAIYWYFHERTLCMSRASLAGAVYRKTTEVKLSAAGDAAALTLMSTDVERIRLGFMNLHEFWANTIEVALASWLLDRQLGAAFVAPLIVVLVCITCAAFVNRFTGRRQKVWMAKIQKRVGLTANVISNMKHLKISGLAAPVERLIQAMRVDELGSSSKFRTVYIIVIAFGYAPLALCPVLTFAVTSRTLDVSTIFTSVSFLLLLADPLTYLFQNTPNLLAAFACLDRIQDFLTEDSRSDYRLSDVSQTTLSDTGSSDHQNEKEKGGSMVQISDGNFGWGAEKPALRNINIDIPSAKLTMFVGPVASGKSTLCKVLLGEIPVSQGRITMGSDGAVQRIGYCDQTPYLSNSTIKQNIIGFSTFNKIRYNEVIEATMLGQDLSILPDGDRTKVGSSGITLSGGQKQRVSLARALYLDSDFFIFDDILSGLDADTEDQVFARVFGTNGILRRRNATIVLSTHSVHHLPSADHIVALGEYGTIVEQGSFETLMANENYVHSLDVKAKTTHSLENNLAVNITNRHISGVDEDPVAELVPFSYLDKKDRMLGDSTVYRYYLSSLGKTSITAFIMFGLGWGFFYNWGNVWLQFWSEDVTSTTPAHSNSFYIGLYAVFQLSYLGSMFFSFLICFKTMIEVSGSKLHKAALKTVISAPLRFFTTTDTGLITNLFSQDMTLIDNELPIAITNLACDVANALGMAAVIASSSPYLAISYPFIFVILYVIQKFYLRTSRQLRLLDLEAKSPLYTHFLDTIRGVATFRAFGWVQEGIDLNNRLLDNSQRPTYLLAMVQRWLGFALQVVVAVLAVAIVTLATQLRSSTGLTGASLVTLMTFGDILAYIIRWYTQIETSIGAVSRLKNFSRKVKSESLEGEDVVPPREWPLKGGIEIRGVSASYSDAKALEDPSTSAGDSNSVSSSNLALKDLNITIKPGEKVAICGRSGSGKSSTILLLLRLLDPLQGCSENIIIDDIPLHKIDRSTLRERIIAVPQDAVFLPDGSSFMSNLDPFDSSNEDECRGVLELVGLWPLIDQRGGLKSGMSPGSLSQGQKQLFSLARAILRRRIRSREHEAEFGVAVGSKEKVSTTEGGGILLLDEVSSSVDQETDRLMQRIIMEEFQNYTIVMVSHRLELVMSFDIVLVMDKGSVVESGKPRELAEKEEGSFRELWMIGHKS
ncbi:ABC transporter [Mollisia scopiformis]|uniref:ABC transporter n=1 Tax=Mollisia scopiformis TaxID=149040 RepID=A0A194WTP3_MOLSC|nr:ABC transporter [Mollisia scopiformis]KUJ11330.1 ABC transporter [Mollisia scopiformis]